MDSTLDLPTQPFCNVRVFVEAVKSAFQHKGPHIHSQLQSIVQSFQFSLGAWKSYVSFDDVHYSRNLIALDENFSIMLLCWNKGQGTPIHEHDPGCGEHCWIKVLDGTLTMKQYSSYSPTTEEAVVANALSLDPSTDALYFDDSIGLHKIENASDENTAISIHIYSPPYVECCFKTVGGKKGTIPVVYRPVSGFKNVQRMECQLEAARSGSVYTSLDSLVDILRHELQKETFPRTPETIERVRGMLQAMHFNPKEFREYAHFTDGHYTRNLVGYDEKFTLLILCWEKGQASPIHDHPNSSCWVKILEGEMRETKFKVNATGDVEPFMVSYSPAENVTYMDDSVGIHKMENPSTTQGVISLHVYSPPIFKCFAYDPQTGTRNQVTLGRANAAQNPFLEKPLSNMHESVPSVKALVSKLCNTQQWDHSTVSRLLNCARFDEQEWAEYVHFSNHRYTRILVAFNEMFSLILICWNPGQSTPLHDHQGENRRVWFRVLQGTLKQTKCTSYEEPLNVSSVETFTPNSGVILQPDSLQIHKLENVGKEVAISLHLYSPPYVECLFTDRVSGEEKLVPVVYCSKTLVDRPLLPEENKNCFRDLQKECLQHRKKIFSNFHSFVELLRAEFISSTEFCHVKVEKLLKSFQFNPKEWRQYVRFNPTHYTRVLVAQDTNFSLILTCWDKDQRSPIHDHSGAFMWLKVMEGKLKEVRYSLPEDGSKALVQTSEHEHSIDAVTCMNDTVIHQITNICDTGSVSMHLYSPPPSECNCYELEGDVHCISIQDIFQETLVPFATNKDINEKTSEDCASRS